MGLPLIQGRHALRAKVQRVSRTFQISADQWQGLALLVSDYQTFPSVLASHTGSRTLVVGSSVDEQFFFQLSYGLARSSLTMSELPASPLTSRKRSHDGTVIAPSQPVDHDKMVEQYLPTPSSGTPSLGAIYDHSRQVSPALSATSSSLTDLTDITGEARKTSINGTAVPPKKRKLTFAEKQVRDALKKEERDAKEKQKAEDKAHREKEKMAKDEEKRRKEEEKEESRREKELEKLEKQKERDAKKAVREEEKRKKDEEKLKKEAEQIKKQRVS